MEAFCRRCDYRTESVDFELLSRGECPTCNGQLFVGAMPSPSDRVEGAVAMLFDAGSRVATPIVALFEERSLRPPEEVQTQVGVAPLYADPEATNPNITNPLAHLDHEVTREAPLPSHLLELAARNVTDSTREPPAAAPAFEPPAPAQDLAPPPASPSALLEDETTAVGRPAPDPSTETTYTGEAPVPSWPSPSESAPSESGSTQSDASDSAPPQSTGWSASADTETTPAETPTGASLADEPVAAPPPASGELPAHLQLPSIDFSLPPGVTAGQPSEGSSTAGSDLPAHLQLPNFPQFELPELPGQEGKRRLTGEINIEGIPGGSFAAMADAAGQGSAAAPEGAAGATEGWAVGQGSAAPPPVPPPRRRTKRAASVAATAAPDAMPQLPQLVLPTVKPMRREPTLVQNELADEIALATAKRRSPLVGLAVTAAVVVAVGAGAYVARDQLVAFFAPKQQVTVSETAHDKARAKLAEGRASYDAGKLDAAIVHFKEALELWATFGGAHRAIAIAFAKQNNANKAVEHYRIYLSLEPNADDAGEVRKIIADYEAKVAKAPPTPPEGDKKRRSR